MIETFTVSLLEKLDVLVLRHFVELCVLICFSSRNKNKSPRWVVC